MLDVVTISACGVVVVVILRTVVLRGLVELFEVSKHADGNAAVRNVVTATGPAFHEAKLRFPDALAYAAISS